MVRDGGAGESPARPTDKCTVCSAFTAPSHLG